MQTFDDGNKSELTNLSSGGTSALYSEIDAPVVAAFAQYDTFDEFARLADECFDPFFDEPDGCTVLQLGDMVAEALALAGFAPELCAVQRQCMIDTGEINPEAALPGMHREFVAFMNDWIVIEDYECFGIGSFAEMMKVETLESQPEMDDYQRYMALEREGLEYMWDGPIPARPDYPRRPKILETLSFYNTIFDENGWRLPEFGGSETRDYWQKYITDLEMAERESPGITDDIIAANPFGLLATVSGIQTMNQRFD